MADAFVVGCRSSDGCPQPSIVPGSVAKRRLWKHIGDASMNPSLPEEAGQTARSFLDIMRQQPALLGSILTNFALVAFIFYALQSSAGYRERLTQQVLDNERSINTILTQRAVACPDYRLQSDETKPVKPDEPKP